MSSAEGIGGIADLCKIEFVDSKSNIGNYFNSKWCRLKGKGIFRALLITIKCSAKSPIVLKFCKKKLKESDRFNEKDMANLVVDC